MKSFGAWILTASHAEARGEREEADGKHWWYGSVRRRLHVLHAEDPGIAEALVACWCRRISASLIDFRICFRRCDARLEIFDAQSLALFHARTGCAARSGGREVRVTDGVDATK